MSDIPIDPEPVVLMPPSVGEEIYRIFEDDPVGATAVLPLDAEAQAIEEAEAAAAEEEEAAFVDALQEEEEEEEPTQAAQEEEQQEEEEPLVLEEEEQEPVIHLEEEEEVVPESDEPLVLEPEEPPELASHPKDILFPLPALQACIDQVNRAVDTTGRLKLVLRAYEEGTALDPEVEAHLQRFRSESEALIARVTASAEAEINAKLVGREARVPSQDRSFMVDARVDNVSFPANWTYAGENPIMVHALPLGANPEGHTGSYGALLPTQGFEPPVVSPLLPAAAPAPAIPAVPAPSLAPAAAPAPSLPPSLPRPSPAPAPAPAPVLHRSATRQRNSLVRGLVRASGVVKQTMNVVRTPAVSSTTGRLLLPLNLS